MDFQELLKSRANRLARLAMSESGRQTVDLLQGTGLLGHASDHIGKKPLLSNVSVHSSSPTSASQAATPFRIGIWEREANSSYFVRSTSMMEDWNFWAQTGRIEPKHTKARIVLIGESVARGYLYD